MLTEEEAGELAAAIRENHSAKRPDEVGEGSSKLPAGSRVCVGVPVPTKNKNVATCREKIADVVAHQSVIKVLLRPFESKQRAPLLDAFAKALAANKQNAKQLARGWGFSIEQLMDQMLLNLWDACSLAQSDEWTQRGQANLPADETLEIARWFLRGRAEGAKPIFDGMCCQCGALLYGDANKSTLKNKYFGPPTTRDGYLADSTSAQPPTLHRYSPRLFAEEMPYIFEHDPETNKLSLKPGVREPWIRPPNARIKDSTHTWLYCGDCHERCFAKSKRTNSQVPFRDRASQCLMKGPQWTQNRAEASRAKAQGRGQGGSNQVQPQEEPEGDEEETQQGWNPFVLPEDREEPVGDETGGGGEEHFEEEGRDRGEEANFSEAHPSLAEYMEKWSTLLAQHSKVVAGPFGKDNLVPQPDSRLWQDCPHVPFSHLKSDAAQARLSVCQPISGLQEQNVVGGVPTYAHNTGEVKFASLSIPWKLSPLYTKVIGGIWIEYVFVFDYLYELKTSFKVICFNACALDIGMLQINRYAKNIQYLVAR